MFSAKRAIKYIFRKYHGFYVKSAEVKAKAERMISERGNGLDRIGFIHGTDKASLYKIAGSELRISHDYLRHYDFMFGAFREEKFSIVEFGCFKGESLRMWEQYFPNAEIYGIDLDESTKQYEKGRVHIVIGDATSQDTYDKLKAETGGAFIILDDASHAWGDQRRAFELFWDLVTPGGFYVVEDLLCGAFGAYSQYPPKVVDAQPFLDYIHDRCEYMRGAVNSKPVENTYLFNRLPAQIQKIEREMDMCVFIPGAVIVRKKA